jgi:hypothetical protein
MRARAPSSQLSQLLHPDPLACTSPCTAAFFHQVGLTRLQLTHPDSTTALRSETPPLNIRPNACAQTWLETHEGFGINREARSLPYISLLISHVAALYIFAGGYCNAAFSLARILYWASGEQGRASASVLSLSLSSSFTSPPLYLSSSASARGDRNILHLAFEHHHRVPDVFPSHQGRNCTYFLCSAQCLWSAPVYFALREACDGHFTLGLRLHVSYSSLISVLLADLLHVL